LNVQGAFLEVMADTLGSLGVVVAAVVIRFTGWTAIDPLIAAAIGLFVVPRTLRLGRQALRILMQSAPESVDVESLCLRLERIPGVDEVHDLHVWTLSSGMDVGSVHLRVASDTADSSVLDAARAIFRDEYGIDHATIQVEKPEGACRETLW
jgi:cobalt-zinc-cadmium efflux system protein